MAVLLSKTPDFVFLRPEICIYLVLVHNVLSVSARRTSENKPALTRSYGEKRFRIVSGNAFVVYGVNLGQPTSVRLPCLILMF